MNLKNVLVFDTETTGLPPKGAHYENDFDVFPHIVHFAWGMNGIEKEYIIKPDGYVIPEEATEIHGISQDYAMSVGVPIKEVVIEFIDDCLLAEVIVAHNIYFDTSVIKANIMRLNDRTFYDEKAEPALDKDKRVDTMMKCIKFVGVTFPDSKRFKFPKLEELYFKLFKSEFPAHNAMEDVRAVFRCLPELVKEGIIELKRRDPKREPLDFNDPNPVSKPIGVAISEIPLDRVPDPVVKKVKDTRKIVHKTIGKIDNDLLSKDINDF